MTVVRRSFKSFSVAQMVKNLPAMQETRVQSLDREDSPGEGNGYPLQYSCLGNRMDRGLTQGIYQAIVLTYQSSGFGKLK